MLLRLHTQSKTHSSEKKVRITLIPQYDSPFIFYLAGILSRNSYKVTISKVIRKLFQVYFKVILCASEHIVSIVRYCFRMY